MNALIINCSPVRYGATAEIVSIANHCLQRTNTTQCICIDDYSFSFCTGCRTCHQTGKCVQHDDIDQILSLYEWADVILSVSPSYWADIPGQFKAFIDRCTPWCNTHDPHASIGQGKKGYTIALRTGSSLRECRRIIESIEHFYGHLEIEACGSLALCTVAGKEDVAPRTDEIMEFCESIALCEDSQIQQTMIK